MTKARSHILCSARPSCWKKCAADLAEAVGYPVPRHPERYRLGLRVVNRAGLRSCLLCVAQPCSCAHTDAAMHAPWAIESGLEVVIDTAAAKSAPDWVFSAPGSALLGRSVTQVQLLGQRVQLALCHEVLI